jgi:hypothetical protein
MKISNTMEPKYNGLLSKYMMPPWIRSLQRIFKLEGLYFAKLQFLALFLSIMDTTVAAEQYALFGMLIFGMSAS